jgi:DNA-binding LacI/PurR family transcriptional regulator
MSVTLKHIADELKLSVPSVTYALNGKPGVSETTRQKILDTAERLGYDSFANRGARVLAARRFGKRVATGAIAFAYTTTANHPWLNDSYHRDFVNGAIHEAGERQLDLYFTPHREGEVPRMVRAGSVDGLILQNTSLGLAEQLEEFMLPAVVLCGFNDRLRCLVPDMETGIYLATQHLIEMGHRHIAYIGAYGDYRQGKERLAGYRRALVEYSLPAPATWIVDSVNSSEDEGYNSMALLLARRHTHRKASPFTAVVCSNDSQAMGAARRAQEEGLHIPRDLSITGFDDISVDSKFQPALTSVSFPRFEMGQRAVEWICQETQRLIESGEPHDTAQPAAGIERFPVKLAVHESTQAL